MKKPRHRISKVTTRTGDDGTTALPTGTRVPKSDHRVEAMGAVDELSAVLGVAISDWYFEPIKPLVLAVQNDLFDLGADLSTFSDRISDDKINRLEKELEPFNSVLPPLKEFVLRGGSPHAANLHLACTVCRRAERRVVSVCSEWGQPFNSVNMLRYLNRLSDWLFVMARWYNYFRGTKEEVWKNETQEPDGE